MFTTMGLKEIGNRISEFVAKTQPFSVFVFTFRKLHMLISGYISGDCICLYQDIVQEIAYAYIRIYFRRLHMLISGYISEDCILSLIHI